jgi:hypothetical protein
LIRRLDNSSRKEYLRGNHKLLAKDKQWFANSLQTVLDTYTVVAKEQWHASVDTSHKVLRNCLTPPSQLRAIILVPLEMLDRHLDQEGIEVVNNCMDNVPV